MNDELELHQLGHEINRFIVRLIALFLFVLALMAAGITFAAPRAGGPEECQFFWDVSLVARSLAIQKHDGDASLAVMYHIYGPLRAPRDKDDERAAEIIRMIVTAAQASKSKTAGEFAALIGNTCMRQGGNMDSILGTRS